MATQNIDLGNTSEVTYDGSDVNEIKLNGTTIWTGCYIVDANANNLGGYSQPGYSDDPTSADYAPYRVYETYRKWPPHWDYQAQFDTSPGSSTGGAGSGFWRDMAGGNNNPNGACIVPKCGYYTMHATFGVKNGAWPNGNFNAAHDIKIGIFVNNTEVFRLCTVNANYIARYPSSSNVGQSITPTSSAPWTNGLGRSGGIYGSVYEKPAGGTTTSSPMTAAVCPGFLEQGDHVRMRGYLSVPSGSGVTPYFDAGHFRLDGGMYGP